MSERKVDGRNFYQEPETKEYMKLIRKITEMLGHTVSLIGDDYSAFDVALNTTHPIYGNPTVSRFRDVWAGRCDRLGNDTMAQYIRDTEKGINRGR